MNSQTILSYAPLVKKIAASVRMRTAVRVDLEDLISAGNIGLLEAFDSYDPGRNVSFDAHAAKRIRWRILDEVRRFASVPFHQLRKFERVRKARNLLVQKNAREPSVKEIAAASGLSEMIVKRYLFSPSFAPVPCDYAADVIPNDTLSDLIDPLLEENEKTVLEALANGLTVPEIVQEHGISREKVAEIKEKIKKILLEVQCEI